MNPWYREPWPWILMSGPAAVIVAGAITTWMAFATADGLVADDYYKRGLAINAVLKREQAAAQRGIEARVERAGGEVRVQLRGTEPPAVFLNLAHATRAGNDVRLRLERARRRQLPRGLAAAAGGALARRGRRSARRVARGAGGLAAAKGVL